jgi:hypothetical protein
MCCSGTGLAATGVVSKDSVIEYVWSKDAASVGKSHTGSDIRGTCGKHGVDE